MLLLLLPLTRYGSIGAVRSFVRILKSLALSITVHHIGQTFPQDLVRASRTNSRTSLSVMKKTPRRSLPSRRFLVSNEGQHTGYKEKCPTTAATQTKSASPIATRLMMERRPSLSHPHGLNLNLPTPVPSTAGAISGAYAG